jgi:drug/metabolite transporter (DMT)-like permease
MAMRLKMAGSIALAAVGLGLAPLAKKAALEAGAQPLPLAWATVSLAAVIAVMFILGSGGLSGLRQIPRATWLHVALVGVLGSALVSLLAVIALTGTTATNRGVFQAMYPVATAVAARLLLGERPGKVAYAVIALMTLGLLAMNSSGGAVQLSTSFWLLLATLPLIGLSDVYARRTLDGADAGFVTAGRLLFGALALALGWAAASPWLGAQQLAALVGAWHWVAAAGVATAAGLVGLYRAMDRAGASLAAAFAATAPVLTALGDWALLGASFSVLQLAGIGIVVAGAMVLALRQ